MKRNRINLILIGCCCALAVNYASYSQTTESHSGHTSTTTSTEQKDPNTTTSTGTGAAGGMAAPTDLHSISEKHMNEMMKMKMSGNVDEDFAKMMAHHHQGAIEMSEFLLKQGKDSELKQMAQKSAESQKKDIEKLKAFSAGHKEHTTDGAASKQLMDPMHKMMQKSDNMKMEGSVDQQFVSMMIEHHKSGMEMAEVEINKGTHSELKALAQKIKDEQKKEIDELQKWQNEHK